MMVAADVHVAWARNQALLPTKQALCWHSSPQNASRWDARVCQAAQP